MGCKYKHCYLKTSSFINNSTLTSDNNWGAFIYDEETTDGLLIKGDIVIGCRTWATSVTIPDGMTSIGNLAFSGCSSLTSVIIPEGVTSVGDYAFYGCTGLTSLIIPKSVTQISSGTFYGCSSISDIYCVAENVPSANSGSGAFYKRRGQ